MTESKNGSAATLQARTVAELAEAKRLPVRFLAEQGLEDIEGGGIAIPYYDAGGGVLFRRERDRPGGPRFKQPQGAHLAPYGEWRLADLDGSGVLHLCEGETDTLTLWYQSLHALGLPGSNTAGTLRPGHLAGVVDLYLLPDNDRGGQAFVEGVTKRLREIGFAGRVWVVRLPDGVKDVNELNRRDPDRFMEALDGLKRYARPIDLAPMARSATNSANGNTKPRRPRGRAQQPYVPFPAHALPPAVAELVVETARAIGCDPALVALPALATVAGAIGNSRAIRLKRGWEEPAAAWCATVAESGSAKSPAFDAATGPLRAPQMELYREHRDEFQRHKEELAAWEALPKAKRGPRPEPPGEPTTWVTSDPTIEALGELLRDNPRGVLVARDELDGWFQSFTRYRGKGGGSDRSQWLELHRAGSLLVERLSRERGRLAVPRALVSVCGTIQPGTLAKVLDADAFDAGLGARILMAMPPKRKRVWTEADVAQEVRDSYSDLLLGLTRLGLADLAKRKPCVLTLSEPARTIWIDFFNSWGEVQFTAEGARAACFAKIEGYAARLALLHHVVARVAAGEDDLSPVGEDSIAAGVELARWFANEATRVYAALRETDEEKGRRSLTEYLRAKGGRATARELMRWNCRRFPDRAAALAEMSALVEDGQARWAEASPGKNGKPVEAVELTGMTHDTHDAAGEDDHDAHDEDA